MGKLHYANQARQNRYDYYQFSPCWNFEVNGCCKNHYFCNENSKHLWKYVRDSPHHKRPKCFGNLERRYVYDDEDYSYCYEPYDEYAETGILRLSCERCGDYNLGKAYYRPYYYNDTDLWNENINMEPRVYRESIDNHKNKGQLFTNRRWKIKKKNHQYIHDKDNKRKRDKYGNYRSNRRFKKRYQLSLQY